MRHPDEPEYLTLEEFCPATDRDPLRTIIEAGLWDAEKNLQRCLEGNLDPDRLVAIGEGVAAAGRLLEVIQDTNEPAIT